MIFIKFLLILILTLGFIIFSFSSKLKIFQKLLIIIGYAVVFFLILYPSYSDEIAHMVSIKSGTDLIIYIVLALTVLMNIILYVGQNNNNRVLTKIIRETAKKDAKNVNNSFVLTTPFLNKFKDALMCHYGYEQYMDFLIVPSISGQKTLAYLPLLNYTDRVNDEVDDLLELAKDNTFQIRTLNFEYKDFKQNDTVTMRLDIDAKSSERVFAEDVKSRCRNKIRNAAKKYNYRLDYGNKPKDIEAFYEIFCDTMYKHGTPVLGKDFFYILTEEFGEDIIFFNVYDDMQVVASMCIIMDDDIAWYPWGGVKSSYANQLAGYYIYWEVLRYICDNTNKKIFDFGRSSYAGSTYKFKSQFGAKPLKIDILTSQQSDIYAKYSLASTVWKKLPKRVVDFIGPKICKYLVDL